MLNTIAVSGKLGYDLELKKDKNGKPYIRSQSWYQETIKAKKVII